MNGFKCNISSRYNLLSPPVDLGRLRFYQDSSIYIFLLFSSSTLRARQMDLSKTDHILGSECNLKMHVHNLGYPLPVKSGVKNHLFATTLQLSCNLNSLYLWKETQYTQSASALETTRALLLFFKML